MEGKGFDMKIEEMCDSMKRLCRIEAVTVDCEGNRETKEEWIIAEHNLDVYVGETLAMKMVCTPEYLPELVLGGLFSEGMITNSEEVERIHICESGKTAHVDLNRTGESFVCGASGEDFGARFLKWKMGWVRTLCELFEEDMFIHQKTRSAHICFLMIDGTVVFKCEDIGRHNALDKAIGYALRNNLDLGRAVVFISGRIPTDMINKVKRAGIPVLVSKAAPTREAVEIAKNSRITLIGMAKGKQVKIYADYS